MPGGKIHAKFNRSVILMRIWAILSRSREKIWRERAKYKVVLNTFTLLLFLSSIAVGALSNKGP